MKKDIFLEAYVKMMTGGIIKEQEETENTEQQTNEPHFYLKLFMQDFRSVEPPDSAEADDGSWEYVPDEDDDEEDYDDEEEYNDDKDDDEKYEESWNWEFIGTAEDYQVTKDFEEFGGEYIGGDTDSAERAGGPNMGDICYYYEFKDISLSKLFELAKKEESGSGIPYGELWTNDDNGEGYEWTAEDTDPNHLAKCLQIASDCGNSFAVAEFRQL